MIIMVFNISTSAAEVCIILRLQGIEVINDENKTQKLTS